MSKYLLTIMALMVSTSSFATNYNQYCAKKDDRSEVCQAYMQGFNDGKRAVKVTSASEKESFLDRALEQRVGEGARKQDRLNRDN